MANQITKKRLKISLLLLALFLVSSSTLASSDAPFIEPDSVSIDLYSHGSADLDIDADSMAEEKKRRSFPNGLVIEELAMGKPDGKKASPGKMVSVYYIGKLKKNGEIFDSDTSGAPFKFRLGVGEVIKGWDVGVNGMRVGEKRRLTIPPALGYGAKGAGRVIPPNSWLVFDVELLEVR